MSRAPAPKSRWRRAGLRLGQLAAAAPHLRIGGAAAPSHLRVHGTGVVLPGDVVTMWVDTRRNQLLRTEIGTARSSTGSAAAS